MKTLLNDETGDEHAAPLARNPSRHLDLDPLDLGDEDDDERELEMAEPGDVPG
jgi:hypothetical protein